MGLRGRIHLQVVPPRRKNIKLNGLVFNSVKYIILKGLICAGGEHFGEERCLSYRFRVSVDSKWVG